MGDRRGQVERREVNQGRFLKPLGEHFLVDTGVFKRARKQMLSSL